MGTSVSEVLEFKPSFSSGSTPSFTLTGSASQGTTFTSSSSAAIVVFDRSGDLWVATWDQGRILEFKPPFSTNMNASLVIGQPDFKTVDSGAYPPPSDHTLIPVDIAFDSSGNLWAADGEAGGVLENRILEFMPPFSDGMSASLVIGQPTFVTNSGILSQNGLECAPLCSISFDQAGNLWVASEYQNRVLEYRPPFSSGMDASIVIGQSSFTSGTASSRLNGLSEPFGVAFDPGGNLWVGDRIHNQRVLEFKPPFVNGMSASLALGQPTFGSSIDFDGGSIVFDSQGNLWASDPAHNQVVEFLASDTTVASTSSTSSSTTATSSSLGTASSSLGSSTTSTGSASSSPTTTSSSVSSVSSVTTTSSATSTITSANQVGGIPEFPFQPLVATILTILLVASYLLSRHHSQAGSPLREQHLQAPTSIEDRFLEQVSSKLIGCVVDYMS